MKGAITVFFVSALTSATLAAVPAQAYCMFGCDPTIDHARQIFDNLLKQRFDKPGKVVEFKQTMAERLEMHATGEKGYEIFFNARVEFPDGANLDCKPEGTTFKDGCSPSKHYVTAPRSADPKGRQYIAPRETVTFDEEYRFYEDPKGWKGPDGNVYTQ